MVEGRHLGSPRSLPLLDSTGPTVPGPQPCAKCSFGTLLPFPKDFSLSNVADFPLKAVFFGANNDRGPKDHFEHVHVFDAEDDAVTCAQTILRGIESVTSDGERNGVNIARNAFDGHRETYWDRMGAEIFRVSEI